MTDRTTPLYRYRLSLTGHHIISVMSPIASTAEFWGEIQKKLQNNAECGELYTTIDARLNVADCVVKLNQVCLVDRPWGHQAVTLDELQKRVQTATEAKNTPQKTLIGKSARKAK